MNIWRRSLFIYFFVVSLVQGAPSDNTSAECRRHITRYRTSLLTGKLWAWQMFDSAAKLYPSGFLKGNLVQLGSYDECVQSEAPPARGDQGFLGQYCRVVFTNISVPPAFERGFDLLDKYHEYTPQFQTFFEHFEPMTTGGVSLPMQFGVCGPSTCDPEGIASVAEFNMELLLGGQAQVTAVTSETSCYYFGSRPWDTVDWVAVSVLCVIALLAISATAIDVLKPEFLPILKAFSIRRNLKSLKSKQKGPNTLDCLHGIRVLSMAWIILGHRYTLQSYSPNINLFDFFSSYIHEWSNMVVLNAFLAVDTFLLLSGLLLSYGIYCEKINKGRIFCVPNLPIHYLYRYIRLTIPLGVVILIAATLMEHMSHGPMWDLQVNAGFVNACQKNWWATLLYVNNYITEGGVCVGQSWYLSMDMQLFWVAPLVLIPLVRWPRPTLVAIAALTFASVCAVFGVTYIHELSWTFSALNDLQQATDFAVYVYTNTPMRAAPYLVGIVMGYLLATKRQVRLPCWFSILGWVISSTTCLTVIFSLTIMYDQEFYDPVQAAFYASLHRTAWAIGIAWAIFACVTGHGSWVNYILSLKIWHTLSRLCYCAFLIHLPMIAIQCGIWRHPQYFSNFEVVHGFFGDLLLLALPSLILYLTVEAPTSVLLRTLLKKGTNKRRSGSRTITNAREETP